MSDGHIDFADGNLSGPDYLCGPTIGPCRHSRFYAVQQDQPGARRILSDPRYLCLAICIIVLVVWALALSGVYFAGRNYKRMNGMVEERRKKREDGKV